MPLAVFLLLLHGPRTAFAEVGVRDWRQVKVSASVYSPDDATPVLRTGVGLEVGRRFDRFGIFGNFALNKTYHGEDEPNQISYVEAGPGIEYVNRRGDLRSSVSAGIAILTSSQSATESGHVGWYAELRPIAIRWRASFASFANIIEISPIVFEVAKPLVDPSVTIFDHYFKVSYEW